MQVVYLGGDPRKREEAVGDTGSEGQEARAGRVNEQVAATGGGAS